MTTQDPTERILLLVDHEVASSRTLAQSLKRLGYRVHHASSAEEALPLILELRPDFGVFSLKLPGATGMVLVDLLHRITPQAPIVVLSATLPPALDTPHQNSVHILTKSASADDISAVLSGTVSTITTSPTQQPSCEIEFLQRKLHEHQGNISETARALKMHRRTLQRKLARVTIVSN